MALKTVLGQATEERSDSHSSEATALWRSTNVLLLLLLLTQINEPFLRSCSPYRLTLSINENDRAVSVHTSNDRPTLILAYICQSSWR